MLAVILESGDLGRLYTGLSLLVSTAAEGEPARGLVGFDALAPMLDDRLLDHALSDAAPAGLTPTGRDAFAQSLVELRDTAVALPECRLWACSAAVETSDTPTEVLELWLEGVMSTPRFLRETEGARLVVV